MSTRLVKSQYDAMITSSMFSMKFFVYTEVDDGIEKMMKKTRIPVMCVNFLLISHFTFYHTK